MRIEMWIGPKLEGSRAIGDTSYLAQQVAIYDLLQQLPTLTQKLATFHLVISSKAHTTKSFIEESEEAETSD